jgi:hypothetical protein
VLFVEGHTEQKAVPEFLKRWLDPRLDSPVGVKPVRFQGWAELVKDAPTKAAMYLSSSDVIAVISLLDLYGPTIYPHENTTAGERLDWGKRHLEQKVNQAKFRHFFAVHETEAWLLSDPLIFSSNIRSHMPTELPETVNFNEPPAKLLERVYEQETRHRYKKVTYGKDLFRKLNPNLAYQKCPQLKVLLDEMLLLAKDAGL